MRGWMATVGSTSSPSHWHHHHKRFSGQRNSTSASGRIVQNLHSHRLARALSNTSTERGHWQLWSLARQRTELTQHSEFFWQDGVKEKVCLCVAVLLPLNASVLLPILKDYYIYIYIYRTYISYISNICKCYRISISNTKAHPHPGNTSFRASQSFWQDGCEGANSTQRIESSVVRRARVPHCRPESLGENPSL